MVMPSPEGADEECWVAQVAWGRVMADQRVGRQAVSSPLAQIPIRSCHRRHCKAILVLLQQQPCHLHKHA